MHFGGCEHSLLNTGLGMAVRGAQDVRSLVLQGGQNTAVCTSQRREYLILPLRSSLCPCSDCLVRGCVGLFHVTNSGEPLDYTLALI